MKTISHDPLKVACIRILRDAKNCDIHIGNNRANMLRRALGLPSDLRAMSRGIRNAVLIVLPAWALVLYWRLR